MLHKYKKLYWTEHSKVKMRQYGLSKSKLINLLYKPQRKELGIVSGTMALMSSVVKSSVVRPACAGRQTKNDGKSKYQKPPGEIWLMYKDVKNTSGQIRKIISAWRYPGISKPGESIPIPEDIRQELLKDDFK